ncbi:hypothetical protein [Frondihabitans cladoniiphilus]|uniref:Glutaminase n=1 Tax=Frondihabitans cladoniiphilus TaxID=715785 RepID=A0ABP8WC73_9MICO
MSDVPGRPATRSPAPDPAETLSAIVGRILTGLIERGARDEALAVPKAGRGIGPFRASSSMSPVGRAWRLGVLLVDRDGRLYATGKLTRAVEPGRPQGFSAMVEQRRADRMAASRGKFVEGEVVNYEWTPLTTDSESLRLGSGPLSVGEAGSTREGAILVRWSATVPDRRMLEPYLEERAALLDLESTFDPGATPEG